jgi:hypothetical protein
VAVRLTIAPFVIIMILGIDAADNRLRRLRAPPSGPKEYFQAGRTFICRHNVYTNMPFGVEIHLLGMEVMADWW